MIGIGIGVKQRKLGGYGLAKPVATAATGIGQTSFTANWDAYTGAVYYLLDVSASPTFDTFIYENQQVNAPTTSYVVIGLEPNTTYYYRVRASTEALTDPDAQAFFDRVTTAGGTLSTTEQDAVNTLVVQMKADGIWTKMKAIYPMVGASAAACAQNLKSASFTGTFTAGWTFASTGATPNGTSAYMDTGLNSSISITNNYNHLSYYSRTNSASANPISEIGVANSAPTYLPLNAIILRNPLDQFGLRFYDYSSGSTLNISNNNSQGFFIGNRTSNVVLNAFKNGTKLGTATYTNALNITTVNYTIYIGAINASGSTIQYTDRECAFASIGDGLTDTEASDFYTAVNAFQVSLNRNV